MSYIYIYDISNLRVNTLPFYGSRVLVGLGLHIVEVPRSHSDMPHLVGLLWTSDQTVLTHTTHKN